MRLPHFEHHQPKSLEEALDLMADHRTSVKALAGGTDLLLRMRAGVLAPGHLVSLGRIAGLRTVDFQEGDGLVIGAGARLAGVAEHPAVQQHYPGLAHACTVMATTQIRNMGTVAGNLANAAPSADTAAPLLAYGASLVVVERGGRRQVPLADFFTGPGATVLEPYELIEAIRVPALPERTSSCYMRISARSQVDIAAVGVAGFITQGLDGDVLRARLALAAVAPTPLLVPEAATILEGQRPDARLAAQAAAACVRAAKPIDDLRASAAWRRQMVQVLSQRVLAACLGGLQGGES